MRIEAKNIENKKTRLSRKEKKHQKVFPVLKNLQKQVCIRVQESGGCKLPHEALQLDSLLKFKIKKMYS